MSKTKLGLTIVFVSLLLIALSPITINAQSPRADNGRMVACQAIEKAVKNRMESLVDLATNIETKFASIATRVENFYTNKVVPSGKSISDYNALVSDISTKKSVVDSDLSKAQSDVSAFSCSVDNPRTLLNTFRLDMQTVKAALKDYRTSIKNLIVAVHSVSPAASPSASPTP